MGFGFGPEQIFLFALVILLLFGKRIPEILEHGISGDRSNDFSREWIQVLLALLALAVLLLFGMRIADNSR
jgi:hypothetical protein